MAKSFNSLSVAYLRKRGWTAENVEVHVAVPGRDSISRDLLGFGDVLALHPEHGVLIVQVAATSDMSGKFRKMCGRGPARLQHREKMHLRRVSGNVRAALLAGSAIEIHGWRKNDAANRWEITIETVMLSGERLVSVRRRASA